jgi:hypothetical protein
MEGTKYFFFGLILFLLPAKGVSGNYKELIYQAYISGNMGLWKQTIDEMQEQKNKPDAFILELLNYQYGYIPWCISQKKDNEAQAYIQASLENIRILQKHQYKLSYVNAYLAAIYGFRIGLHPYKAPFLGSKSLKAAKLSMKQDSTNPYGYLQKGNAFYHMPALFGGSKTKAIQYYLHAQYLMEQDRQNLKHNWNYLSLLTSLAQAYEKTSQYDKAYQYYKLILKIEPRFMWVNNELLPEFLNKHKEYAR